MNEIIPILDYITTQLKSIHQKIKFTIKPVTHPSIPNYTLCIQWDTPHSYGCYVYHVLINDNLISLDDEKFDMYDPQCVSQMLEHIDALIHRRMSYIATHL